MLPRIRERIANDVRQGGGENPFNPVNFGNNNNNGNVGRQQQQQGMARNLGAAAEALNNNPQGPNNNAAAAENPEAPQYIRPKDLYFGCSTRVRRELLRINEWDRLLSLKDVWTKQVAEAPTQEDLDQERREGGAAIAARRLQQQLNRGLHNPNNLNPMDPVLGPANANLLRFLNDGAVAPNNNNNNNNNENTDHDIREIMELNIKKQRFRPAFYKVQFFNPTYAANLDLMKLFHRRHSGNPKLAAQQFCRYWDVKLQYFGLEELCKPLTLKALSSQDKACLHNGCMQLSRDEHGRTVLSLLPSLLTIEQANGPPKPATIAMDADDNNNNVTTNTNTTNNNNNAGEEDETNKLVCPHLVRALWYLVFRAIQDNGETDIVILLLGQDKDELFGKTILHCTSVLREALPFHVNALHYLDGPGMSTLDQKDDHQSMDATALRGNNNNQHNNNANRQRLLQDHDDLHGFGGQVAEWGGAVQMPEDQDNFNGVPFLMGAQDVEQQRRLNKKSKSSLEYLEDRVGRNVRLRLRFHNLFQLRLQQLTTRRGRPNDEEVEMNEDPFYVIRKRLDQFGIPSLPLNKDGTLIMHNPIDASSKRFFFTRPEDSLNTNLILPTGKDILLGKGRPYQEHPGNIALNDVIDKHRSDYTSCKTRSEKTAMSQGILDSIQKEGGRFLIKKSKDDDMWVVAAPAKARDKIAHSFRLPRKHLKEAMDKARQQKEEEAAARALRGTLEMLEPNAIETPINHHQQPPQQLSPPQFQQQLQHQRLQQQQQLAQPTFQQQLVQHQLPPNGQQMIGGFNINNNNMQV